MKRFRDEDGQVLVLLMAGMFLCLLGLAGLVIDVGQAYVVKRKLQGTADAAAIAGANSLPTVTTALSSAGSYGVTGKNPVAVAGATASETTTAWCIKSVAYCPGGSPGQQVTSGQANGIQVKESASVPTTFLRLFGISKWTVKAQATACGSCANLPLNIALVVDRTGSMAPNVSDLQAGVKSFEQSLNPALDWISLLVLPPAPGGSDCTGAGNNAFPYNGSSYPTNGDNAYAVVHFSHDYLNAGGSLNTTSTLNTQMACINAQGGTAYKQALLAAANELNNAPSGRSGYQKVIVFETDGAANMAPDSWYDSSTGKSEATYTEGSQKLYLAASGHSDDVNRPCGSAVDTANQLKAQGIIIMTVGYNTQKDDDCYEAPQYVTGGTGVGYKEVRESISATSAVSQIATNGDAYTATNASSMQAAFAGIAGKLIGAKLIPDSDAG